MSYQEPRHNIAVDVFNWLQNYALELDNLCPVSSLMKVEPELADVLVWWLVNQDNADFDCDSETEGELSPDHVDRMLQIVIKHRQTMWT